MGKQRRRPAQRPSPDLVRILVVDDEASQLELCLRILAGPGYRVAVAINVADAVAWLDDHELDVLITDIRIPGADGLELLRYVRANYNGFGIIAMTGYPSIPTAIEATKLGAEVYLKKPFAPKDLLDAVEKCVVAMERRRLADPAVPADESDDAPWGIKGVSPPMLEVHRRIRKFAASDVSVLLLGESGTGKELGARAIHQESARSSGPFMPINCAGVPEQLLESELFGHRRGAFTGADRDKRGLFVAADGGTVFLDEIGAMPYAMQAKLLRVLQDRRGRPVGATREQPFDVRIIAATNSDLPEVISAGCFRGDLLHRLYVARIDMPPLRDRGTDIALLTGYFFHRGAQRYERPAPRLTDAVLDVFHQYEWPGNVRELENRVEEILLLCDGDEIDVPDLPEDLRYQVSAEPSELLTMKAKKRAYLLHILALVNGNKSKAARVLDMDRRTIGLMLKDIEPPPE